MFARPRRPTRRGTATIEFAVVVPILLTFILGIIEVGRLVMVAQVNTNAAREAARYAAQGNASTPTIDSYTRTYLSAAGVNGASSTTTTTVAVEYQSGGSWAATADPSKLPPGTPVRVTVSVNFGQQSWLPAQFFVGSNTRVRGVAVMRRE